MSSKILSIDKVLTERVKDTLDVEEDPEEIADYLRETFPREYARRKVSDFRNIVKKICEELKKQDDKQKLGLTAAINATENGMDDGQAKNEEKNCNGLEKSPLTSEDDVEVNVNGGEKTPPAQNGGTAAAALEGYDPANPDPNASVTNNIESDDSDIICIQEDKSTPAPLYPNRDTIDYNNTNRAPQNSMYMSQEQINVMKNMNYAQNNLRNLANAGFPVSGSVMNQMTEQELMKLNEAHNRPLEDENQVAPSQRKRSKWDQGPPQNGRTRNNRRKKPQARPGPEKRRRRRRSVSSSSSSSDSDADDDFKLSSKKSNVSLDEDVVLPSKTKTYLKKVLSTLKAIELFNQLNVTPPKGLLLHGPAGCGKTLLAKAIPNFLNCEYFYISATELLAGVAGNSEKRIRSIFKAAGEVKDTSDGPLDEEGNPIGDDTSSNLKVVIFDEFDIIAAKSSKTTPVEKRMVSQLCNSLDDLTTEANQAENQTASNKSNIIVIACTSKPETIDTNLRRAGRFDHEIILPIPGENSRREMLQKMCQNVKKSEKINFHNLAKLTPGYVGSDLQLLIREAAQIAVGKKLEERNDQPETEAVTETDKIEENMADDSEKLEEAKKMNEFKIDESDFLTAMENITPASKREGFACVPDVTWENIGALESVREQLKFRVFVIIALKIDLLINWSNKIISYFSFPYDSQ